MNTIKHIYNKVGAGMLLLGALSFSSCNDFLDTLPLNDVVLENYWTEKADVTSVLNSCYESLESGESIMRMAVWGEMRSDNVMLGSSVNNDISEILKENILPTNNMTKWVVMYQTINRCNTVIAFAPKVQKIDPNYTINEMQANIAEATFIRDLCYFYLIRAFRDVPVTFEASIDDQVEFVIPATPMNEALDILINDLKSVENYAVKRYVDDSKMTNTMAVTQAYQNNAKVTRLAIYALLADLNLWRGNYDETVKYCDMIIDFKKQQYKDRRDNLGDLHDMHEFAGVPLILERPEGSTIYGNAYNEIFGTGNSFESIFELYYATNQSVRNDFVSNYYGSQSQPLGNLSAPDVHCKDAYLGNCDLFKANDCRVYETMSRQNSKYSITKYGASSVNLDVSNVTDERSLKLSMTRRGNSYANWIIYRLTDVMLMKAEAQVMRGEQYYESAFAMVNAVNKRARNLTTAAAKDTLAFDDYKQSRAKMEQLVLDERNRELMFEGKRWFDLVRVALRDGTNQHLVSEATVKYMENVNAIKIKLADPNIIFYPYNREELKLNKYLKQNPAYSNTDDFQ